MAERRRQKPAGAREAEIKVTDRRCSPRRARCDADGRDEAEDARRPPADAAIAGRAREAEPTSRLRAPAGGGAGGCRLHDADQRHGAAGADLPRRDRPSGDGRAGGQPRAGAPADRPARPVAHQVPRQPHARRGRAAGSHPVPAADALRDPVQPGPPRVRRGPPTGASRTARRPGTRRETVASAAGAVAALACAARGLAAGRTAGSPRSRTAVRSGWRPRAEPEEARGPPPSASRSRSRGAASTTRRSRPAWSRSGSSARRCWPTAGTRTPTAQSELIRAFCAEEGIQRLDHLAGALVAEADAPPRRGPLRPGPGRPRLWPRRSIPDGRRSTSRGPRCSWKSGRDRARGASARAARAASSAP